ncbi:dipeptidase [bacterium]|nr:dipeptidase [bacterium]
MSVFFDGHNDSLTRHYPPRHLRQGENLDVNSFINGLHPHAHLDLPRAQKTNFAGGFFAIFIDPEPNLQESNPNSAYLAPRDRTFSGDYPSLEIPIDSQLALKATLEVLSYAFKVERSSQGQIRIVRSFEDLLEALNNKQLAQILHLEGCEAIDADLHNLETFYQAGVRSLGLCWSRPNIFGTGVPFANNITPNLGPGLTSLGKALVRECNNLHIVVDLAHLNYRGFFDVAKISSVPLVVSHAGAFSVCPSTRNLKDEQLEAIVQSQGIVGVTFNIPDITGNDEAKDPLQGVVEHIKYIGENFGYDYVGLGSDFDGCTIPPQMDGVEGLELLREAMEQNGLTQEEIDLVCYQNWLRVLERIF